MDEGVRADQAGAAPTEMVIEALSREDGKNATIRVYRDRIEWIKEESISSLPRPKSQPPVIPLHTVLSVKARKDGPLFSKLVLRTQVGTMVFRMYSPQAVQVRDAISGLLAGEPVAAKPAAEPAARPSVADPYGSGPAADDLRQLEALRDDGMLSVEEFEAAKAQLGAG